MQGYQQAGDVLDDRIIRAPIIRYSIAQDENVAVTN
jgi:hypothetical protein